MKKRLDYIDVAKGISIIYVVLSHISIGFLAKHVSSFYMPFFFFLSGLVYNNKKYSSYKELIMKKSSLLKKYFCLSFFLFGIYLLIGKISDSNLLKVIFGIFYSRYYMYKNSVDSLLTISNNALWFLTSLFLVFVLYFFICKISKNKIQKIIGSVFLLMVGIILNNYCTFLFPWNFDTSLICVIFFCFGDILKEKIKIEYEKFNISKLCLLLVIALVLNLFSINLNGMVNLSIGIYSNYLLFAIGALSGIVMYLIVSMFISKYLLKLNKLLSYIGKNSLNIFLYHMPIINLVLMPIYSNYFNKLILYRNTLSFGLFSTFLVIVSIIVFTCFKRRILEFWKLERQ